MLSCWHSPSVPASIVQTETPCQSVPVRHLALKGAPQAYHVSASGFTLAVSAPPQALWLVAMSAAGIAIVFLAVTCILPVTSHQIFRQQMATALGQLAGVAVATVSEIMPKSSSSSQGASRRQEGASAQQEWREAGQTAAEVIKAQQGPIDGQTAPAAAAGAAADAAIAACSGRGFELPSSTFASAAMPEGPGTPPGVEGAASPTEHPSTPRRLPLRKPHSLIVLPPEPGALSGNSRKQLRQAVRQLRAPAGPELMVDCEHFLGKAYSRFFFESLQVRVSLPAVPHRGSQSSSGSCRPISQAGSSSAVL